MERDLDTGRSNRRALHLWLAIALTPQPPHPVAPRTAQPRPEPPRIPPRHMAEAPVRPASPPGKPA